MTRIPYTAPDLLLDATILVDIDGTLARRVDRGPFDWAKVKGDDAIQPVVDLVEDLLTLGYNIVFMSGREDTGDCRKDTLWWLHQHLPSLQERILYEDTKLFMRDKGDFRPDDEVKYELFDLYIRDTYDISFVLDDRDKVVKMWREIGLTCLQVAEGNF